MTRSACNISPSAVVQSSARSVRMVVHARGFFLIGLVHGPPTALIFAAKKSAHASHRTARPPPPVGRARAGCSLPAPAPSPWPIWKPTLLWLMHRFSRESCESLHLQRAALGPRYALAHACPPQLPAHWGGIDEQCAVCGVLACTHTRRRRLGRPGGRARCHGPAATSSRLSPAAGSQQHPPPASATLSPVRHPRPSPSPAAFRHRLRVPPSA